VTFLDNGVSYLDMPSQTVVKALLIEADCSCHGMLEYVIRETTSDSLTPPEPSSERLPRNWVESLQKKKNKNLFTNNQQSVKITIKFSVGYQRN